MDGVYETSTILAEATPAGVGAVSILRLSGPKAFRFAFALTGLLALPVALRQLAWLSVAGERIDRALVLFFPNPASFTGEDVVEFHLHGNPLIVQKVICACLGLGAELARAGEFSERAFLNGKLALPEAEAIMELISARSDLGLKAALRSLGGELSLELLALSDMAMGLKLQQQVCLDFPLESEGQELGLQGLRLSLMELQKRLERLALAARNQALLRRGLRVTLCGRPNAGKSSLFNALLSYDRALVSPLAGTTRDYLQEEILLEGFPVQLTDTAGIWDESESATEQEGMVRAKRAIGAADLVLYIYDASLGLTGEEQALLDELGCLEKTFLVANKSDLSGIDSGVLSVSAKTGAGLEELRGVLVSRFFGDQIPLGEECAVNARQAILVEAALGFTRECLDEPDEARQHFLLEQIVASLNTLRFGGESGGGHREDAEIFRSFCLGK